MPTRLATIFRDVLVVSRAERGWLCEIDARAVFLDQRHLAPGSRMPAEGQRGDIAVTAEGADDVRCALGPREPRVRVS